MLADLMKEKRKSAPKVFGEFLVGTKRLAL